MGYTIVKKGLNYSVPKYFEIIITDEMELSNLPQLPQISVGSVAYLPDLSKLWMLDEDGQWNEV